MKLRPQGPVYNNTVSPVRSYRTVVYNELKMWITKKICAHILIHNAGVRGAHAQEQIYLRVREIAPETHRQIDRNPVGKLIYY